MSLLRIEIPGFVLSKATIADGDKYYSLSNNPNVMKFVTGYALTRQESDAMLADFILENKSGTYFGRYLIENTETGELVGLAKLEAYGQEVEIGYRVMEEYWGKGIATEIARNLIKFSNKTFHPKAVIAFVDVRNAASIRVLEKAGMKNIATLEEDFETKYKFEYPTQTHFYMKRLLYFIFALIAIVLIAALIMPKDYAVEREIVITKPKAEVFAYLKSLKNQDNWSVWMRKDPRIKKSFKGTDGTVGYTAMWEGNDEVGQGEQEIKKIAEGERIDTELRFLKPFESTNDAYMTTESLDSTHTKVKWGFAGKMPIPMNVMMPFMGMEKSVGKDFADGLTNLKQILEK